MNDNLKKILELLSEPNGLANIGRHVQRRFGTFMQMALVGPNQIRINPLSYTCNNRCPMCNLQQLPFEELTSLRRRELKNGLKLKDYRNLLKNRLSGLASVNVTGGGEPLSHPEIIDILLEIKKHALRGSLITNGVLLDATKSRAIVNMGWDGVRVSIHAAEPGLYQKVTGKDDFEKLKGNLSAFNRIRRKSPHHKKCQLKLFAVIQRENFSHLDRLFFFAEEIGADYLEFDRIILFDKSMRLSADELKMAKSALSSCAKASTIDSNLKNIIKQLSLEEYYTKTKRSFRPAKRCSVGFDQVFITSEGDVYPCCFSDEIMGNVRKEPFETIWNSGQFNDFRIRMIKGRFANYCYTSHCTLSGVLHNF